MLFISGSSNSGNTPKMEIEESSVDLPTENQTTKDEYDENSIQNMINPNKQNSMDIDNMNFDIEMDQKPLFDISEGEEYTDNSVMDIPDISPLEVCIISSLF